MCIHIPAEGTKTNSVTVSASPKSTSKGTIKPVSLIFTPSNSLTVAKPAFSTANRKLGSLHISSVTPPSGTKSNASTGSKSVHVMGKTSFSLVISMLLFAYIDEVNNIQNINILKIKAKNFIMNSKYQV